MSTFNGLVAEFPDIRIDFFRSHAGRRPPVACFLSHIHSDHLAGLETLRSPFVYCSAATREMLLRLERYPCRVNYAKGILEARVQTYKHLKNLLKPLPLETPTTLELAPGSHIQVTLFDANHCPGAVMFLIEDLHHAILYTGDIRSEPWFVNSIARNPTVIEYTSGLKTLDKIYLDTSFITDVPFQTKAEGIAELLRKVALYPNDTIFHIQAWTYGYEQVWIALSKALKSRIHVDDYKMRMFSSLTDIAEVGVGGGGDDLERDAELDPLSTEDMKATLTLIDETTDVSADAKSRLLEALKAGVNSGRNMPLDLEITTFGEKSKAVILDAFQTIGPRKQSVSEGVTSSANDSTESLPRAISFPYSRHSSCQELCDLVRVFRPKDVWPCTVNIAEWLRDNITIGSLFGRYCSGDIFSHDLEMEKVACGGVGVLQRQASQDAASRQPLANEAEPIPLHYSQSYHAIESDRVAETGTTTKTHAELSATWALMREPQRPDCPGGEAREAEEPSISPTFTQQIQATVVASRIRADAYLNMTRNLAGGEWTPIGLLSTADHHTAPDKDLGMV
ncbi:artemis protein [Colletotrichum tofieldiae]|nr:artemis protein [Colletotrichum tofieldiae]GKT77554.1 artemis protein [Colletotrichum tofieldiae]